MDSNPHKHKIIESALAGGFIGAALGALLTGKSETSVVAAMVGAAINASLGAQEEAKQLNIPVLFEENSKIFKKHPDGSVEYVRSLSKSEVEVPRNFSIG